MTTVNIWLLSTICVVISLYDHTTDATSYTTTAGNTQTFPQQQTSNTQYDHPQDCDCRRCVPVPLSQQSQFQRSQQLNKPLQYQYPQQSQQYQYEQYPQNPQYAQYSQWPRYDQHTQQAQQTQQQSEYSQYSQYPQSSQYTYAPCSCEACTAYYNQYMAQTATNSVPQGPASESQPSIPQPPEALGTDQYFGSATGTPKASRSPNSDTSTKLSREQASCSSSGSSQVKRTCRKQYGTGTAKGSDTNIYIRNVPLNVDIAELQEMLLRSGSIASLEQIRGTKTLRHPHDGLQSVMINFVNSRVAGDVINWINSAHPNWKANNAFQKSYHDHSEDKLSLADCNRNINKPTWWSQPEMEGTPNVRTIESHIRDLTVEKLKVTLNSINTTIRDSSKFGSKFVVIQVKPSYLRDQLIRVLNGELSCKAQVW